jgi:RND family efflux transporter MFP subunit
MSRIWFARIDSRAMMVILMLLFLVACGGTAEDTDAESAEVETPQEAADSEDAAEKPAAKKKKRKESSTSVTVTPATRGDLVLPVVGEGSLRARHSTEIKFEISGDLTRVWVKEGQRVRKGQKLVSLDDREYQLALEEARTRYLQALGQLAVEEDGYSSEGAERVLAAQREELRQLEKAGTITRGDRLDRELELGMAAVRDGAYRRELLEVRSGLAAARADISRLELDLERALLLAPFDGVVSQLTLSSGERVQAGMTFCRLVDDVNIEAEIGVLESDLGSLEVGRAAFLHIPALDVTMPVTIDVISPYIDEGSRTCSILMRIKNKDGQLKPGMFAKASIAGETFPDRLLVPREAIVTRDGRPVVFRVEDKRAKWVYVQLGLRNDYVVEITRVDQGGPLEPGTPVIVDNHLTMTHDAKVKVKKTRAIADPWTVAEEQN